MKLFKYLALAFLLMLPIQAHASAISNIQVQTANGSFAITPSVFVLSRALAANTAESITVPTGPNGQKANFVSFASTCDFYANWTTTATVPADVTNGTASELNPLLRIIPAGTTTISVISAATCVITASFYM